MTATSKRAPGYVQIVNPENEPILMQLAGSYVEYRILSTDPFPAIKAEEKGATCYVMDTDKLHMNNGTSWAVIG